MRSYRARDNGPLVRLPEVEACHGLLVLEQKHGGSGTTDNTEDKKIAGRVNCNLERFIATLHTGISLMVWVRESWSCWTTIFDNRTNATGNNYNPIKARRWSLRSRPANLKPSPA